MNRFRVLPCLPQSEVTGEDSDKMVLPLGSDMFEGSVLFFPVTSDTAEIINSILSVELTDLGEHAPENNIIEIYKTMLNSWTSGERFLSGIYIDLVFDKEKKEDVINVYMMLASSLDGYTEAVLKTNFVQAIIIAAIEDMDIMISDELVNTLLPPLIDHEETTDEKYPVDKKILDIAKRIMSGKVK